MKTISFPKCPKCGAILLSAFVACTCVSAHVEPHPEGMPIRPAIMQPVVAPFTTGAMSGGSLSASTATADVTAGPRSR
jgi:hypothetical protein